MASILRGEIYWVDINPTMGHEQSGIRPVLILSSNIFNEKSGTVIGMAITSQKPKAGYPLSYSLEDEKLPKPSWVKIGQVRTLSTDRIHEVIGKINDEKLREIIEGLNEILGT